MNRIILLPFLFVIYSCSTTNHIPNKKVEVDFSNPVYPSVITIKPRQTIELVLQNVNPYLYEITVKDSLVVHQAEQPALFSQVFKLPELNITPTEVPPANAKVANALPKDKTTAKQAKEDESLLETDLKIFVASYPGKVLSIKDVLSLSTIADDINKLLTNCYYSIAQLKSLADSYIISKISITAGTLPIGIQSEIANISNSARRNIEQYIVDGEELKKKHKAILDRADDAMSLAQYKSIEKDLSEKIAIIEKILDNSRKLLEKLTAFDDAKIGIAIEDNYNKVMTSRIEKTIFRTTYYRTDEVIMNIQVKKKKEMYCSKDINDFPVSALVRGGIKIDFSTGVVFNIGKKNFFNQKYHYDSVYRGGNQITDSVRITSNQNNNLVMPSLGAFLHVYSRFVSPVNFGGMVGASLGADQRSYIHLGGCLLIGKSDRLIIGGGVSFANGKYLDGQYSEGQQIKRSYAPILIPTEDVSRIGGYVSISWNLNLIK